MPEFHNDTPRRRHEYRVAQVPRVGAGARYKYRLDGQEFPDPVSRSQPEGVHGRSEVVDPRQFEWNDDTWSAPPLEDLVIYEAHIGTLTPEGTFDAAIGQLPRLRALGFTAIRAQHVTLDTPVMVVEAAAPSGAGA